MKTLYIVRHAKSSWDHPGLEDHQRPLIEKGKKRTRYVIDYLQDHEVRVDLLMSSHAVRAHETAKLIAEGIQYPLSDIQVSKDLYFGYADGLFDVFYEVSDDVDSVMIVGHNPTFTYFANNFLDKKIDNLPTSAVVCIAFDTKHWSEIQHSERKVKFVISPRLLKQNRSSD